MAIHNDLGSEGEELAAQYYQQNGYEILDRNWRFGRGEIDIICRNKEYLVIVEVKTRQAVDFVSPRDLVSKKKQRSIIKTAHAYIVENAIDLECRFDLLIVDMGSKTPEIQQIAPAFYPLVK